MGNLANKMLEAMGIISDAAVASAGFDRSVQVQIIGLRDQSNDKEYRVSYNGVEKSAIGQPGYTSGELVWAVVPGNDFSQNLQILGPVSEINAASQVLRSQDDKFEKVSPGVAVLNIDQQYTGNNITLYEASEVGEDYNILYNILGLNHDRIIDTINTSLFFEISTTIESKISSPTGNENFGIKCSFNKNTIGQKGIFTLDINDLSGNPYFLQEELQKKVFSIPAEDRTLKLLKIELFFENIPAGSEIKFYSFSFYGVREVDRENGLSATLQVVEGDTGRYVSEDVYPYTLSSQNNIITMEGVVSGEHQGNKYTITTTNPGEGTIGGLKVTLSEGYVGGHNYSFAFAIRQIPSEEAVLNAIGGHLSTSRTENGHPRMENVTWSLDGVSQTADYWDGVDELSNPEDWHIIQLNFTYLEEDNLRYPPVFWIQPDRGAGGPEEGENLICEIEIFGTIPLEPQLFKSCLRKDGIIVQDSLLSNYSYQWYLKTLNNGAALRIIEPSLNDENFINTTLNWEIETNESDILLKQYKGNDSVVYIPDKIIAVAEYDSEEDFPERFDSQVYYDKEAKQFFLGNLVQGNQEYNGFTDQEWFIGTDVALNSIFDTYQDEIFNLTFDCKIEEDDVTDVMIYTLSNGFSVGYKYSIGRSTISNVTNSWQTYNIEIIPSIAEGSLDLESHICFATDEDHRDSYHLCIKNISLTLKNNPYQQISYQDLLSKTNLQNDVKIGDGSNSLFRASNKVEAIVAKGELSYTRPTGEGATVENTYFNNLNASTVFYNYTNGDIDNFRIINDLWFTEGSNPNEFNISQDAFFMPESWLYCKITDLVSGETTETNIGKIENNNSLYDLEFNVGDIVLNGSKWNQTLGFGAESLPDDLIFTWKKDGEKQEAERGSTATVEISPVANQNWSVEVERNSTAVSNFFIISASHEVAARANPQSDDSATITGQSVFLLKEDGTLANPINRELTVYLTEDGEAVSDLTNFRFNWKLNGGEISNTSGSFFASLSPNNNKLTFTTKAVYNATTSNNIITCEVTGPSFAETARFEPVFLKNGMPGTNGTDYFCGFTFDGGQSFSNYIIRSNNDTLDTISSDNIKIINSVSGRQKSPETLTLYTIYFNQKTNATRDPTCYPGSNIIASCKIAGDDDHTYNAYLSVIAAPEGYILKEQSSSSLWFYFNGFGQSINNSSIIITFNPPEDSSLSLVQSQFGYVTPSFNNNILTIDLSENFQYIHGQTYQDIVTLQIGDTLNYNDQNTFIDIPILFLNNRYEYASINGWDGTSIKLDETNDTVLAPTAGFGKKESDNSFTGVMLGSITSSNSIIASYSSFDSFPTIEEASNNTFYLDESTQTYYVKRATETEGVYEYRESLPPDFSGILGMNHGNQTFSLNADNGNAWFKGHIEATSGKIGGVEIEEVISQSQNILSENLISHTATIAKQVSTPTKRGWSLEKQEGATAQGTKLDIYNILKENTDYVLQYFFQPDDEYYGIGGHVASDAYTITQWSIDEIVQTRSYFNSVDTTSLLEVEGRAHKVIINFQKKANASGSTDTGFYIQLNRGSSKGGSYFLSNIQLNEGTIPFAPWAKSIHDQLNAEINSIYSWRFSPDYGMYMWYGYQGNGLIATDTDDEGALIGEDNDDDNLLFRIKDNKLWMRGDGEFTGKITANEGEIAGWGIAKDSSGGQLIACRDQNGNILDPTWDNFSSALNRIGLFTNCPNTITIAGVSKSDWRIVAGTNFGIDASGQLYAENGVFKGEISAGSTIGAADSQFYVDKTGRMSARDATLSGLLKTTGDLGYIELNASALKFWNKYATGEGTFSEVFSLTTEATSALEAKAVIDASNYNLLLTSGVTTIKSVTGNIIFEPIGTLSVRTGNNSFAYGQSAPITIVGYNENKQIVYYTLTFTNGLLTSVGTKDTLN